MTSAEQCRRNGWTPGTRLIGDEGYGADVIEITAIGERTILAKKMLHDGKPDEEPETCWTLECRKWRKTRELKTR